MKIIETFELFLRKPISILKHGIISLVHIRAENMFAKKSIHVDLMKKKAQITVVNNEKVYNLLKTVTYRASKRQELLEQKNKPKIETLLEINE